MISSLHNGHVPLAGILTTRTPTHTAGGSLEVGYSKEGGVRRVETNGQLDSGASIQRVATSADGVRTVAMSVTSPAGLTRSIEKTLMRDGDGSVAVSGTLTKANGTEVAFTGSIRREGDVVHRSLDLTGPGGVSAHVDITKTPYSEGYVFQAQGTNFSGEEFSREVVRGARTDGLAHRPIDELA